MDARMRETARRNGWTAKYSTYEVPVFAWMINMKTW